MLFFLHIQLRPAHPSLPPRFTPPPNPTSSSCTFVICKGARFLGFGAHSIIHQLTIAPNVQEKILLNERKVLHDFFEPHHYHSLLVASTQIISFFKVFEITKFYISQKKN
jgi:hypothetical protein